MYIQHIFLVKHIRQHCQVCHKYNVINNLTADCLNKLYFLYVISKIIVILIIKYNSNNNKSNSNINNSNNSSFQIVVSHFKPK